MRKEQWEDWFAWAEPNYSKAWSRVRLRVQCGAPPIPFVWNSRRLAVKDRIPAISLLAMRALSSQKQRASSSIGFSIELFWLDRLRHQSWDCVPESASLVL